MDHYTEFISLIHDFIDLFRSLTTVEQQKLDAAVANDLSILEDCMKKEQAFVLRLRGLEQQPSEKVEDEGFKVQRDLIQSSG